MRRRAWGATGLVVASAVALLTVYGPAPDRPAATGTGAGPGTGAAPDPGVGMAPNGDTVSESPPTSSSSSSPAPSPTRTGTAPGTAPPGRPNPSARPRTPTPSTSTQDAPRAKDPKESAPPDAARTVPGPDLSRTEPSPTAARSTSPSSRTTARSGSTPTIRIGSWSAPIARGGQQEVDACREAVQWAGPDFGAENGYALRTIVLVGHDFCGFDIFATLPVGGRVTVETPRGIWTYRVYATHLSPGRGTPAAGLYWGDLTLQSCVGPDTGFSYLMRV